MPLKFSLSPKIDSSVCVCVMARVLRLQSLRSLCSSPCLSVKPYRSIHTHNKIRLVPFPLGSISSAAQNPRRRNDFFAWSPFSCFGFDAIQRRYSSASSRGEDSEWNSRQWIDSSKRAAESVTDAFEKAKERFDEFATYGQQVIDSSPVLSGVVVPIGGTFLATIAAWWVMPRILRRLHKYSIQGPGSLLDMNAEKIPYEKGFWGALEDPVRYLVTFMAFSQLAVRIAPTTFASEYITQTWRGAFVISLVWFLYRWKSNAFDRLHSSGSVMGLDRDRLMLFDTVSSMALVVLGLMGTAEAFGVAVQSILTVGGVGGVAAAFAARDILGNMLSGFSIQFWKPFSIGDSIKAGSIEGQVLDIGLTMTSLLNSEKFLVLVPNSLVSSQVIVNKSRAHLRAIATKLPIQTKDMEKIPNISEDIKVMLASLPKVHLERDVPYCFLSKIEDSYAELTVGCNLQGVSKYEFYSIGQDILLRCAQIIRQHGADLGSTRDGCNHR